MGLRAPRTESQLANHMETGMEIGVDKNVYVYSFTYLFMVCSG